MYEAESTRIEILPQNPNPLFQEWLQQWLLEAETKNSKSKYNLKTAIEALKKFPLPLSCGRECAILRGFGPTLCALIDQKLETYKQSNLENYNKSINYDEDVKKIKKKVQKEKLEKQKLKKSPSKTQNSKTKSKNDNIVDDEQIFMHAGSFKIILLVDTQETSGKFKKVLDSTRFYLDNKKVLYEVRRLSVGDFCWICRDVKNNELILPYIVERKRMDDFASSIRDGRFHEQKFRLRNSGIHNLIYLIESYGNNQHVGLPMSTLMQAATNTQIHSGFQIRFTDSHKDSMMYLATLTKILIDKFKSKTLINTNKDALQSFVLDSSIIGLLKFNEFQDGSTKTKNCKVREIFIKQLLQLKSLSIDKALAISEIYPTPRSLLLAYKECETKGQAESLLASIPSGKLNRPVGTGISKIICNFYCDEFSA